MPGSDRCSRLARATARCGPNGDSPTRSAEARRDSARRRPNPEQPPRHARSAEQPDRAGLKPSAGWRDPEQAPAPASGAHRQLRSAEGPAGPVRIRRSCRVVGGADRPSRPTREAVRRYAPTRCRSRPSGRWSPPSACRPGRWQPPWSIATVPSSPSFTQEHWMLSIRPSSSSRDMACTTRFSRHVGPGRAMPAR